MVEQPEPEVQPQRNKGGRPPKNAVPRSERVNMMWTPELKERVRGRVGTRGLTDWVIDAVEEKLAAAPPRTIEEMDQRQAERARRREADHPVPVDEPDQPVVAQHSSLNGRAVEQVEAPVLEPVTERFGSSAGGLSDMLNRAAAMGVETDQGEPPWVTGPVLAPPIIVEDPTICPTCGEPRIDGECWTCD